MGEYDRLQVHDDRAAKLNRKPERAVHYAPRLHPLVAIQTRLGNRQVNRLLAQRQPGEEEVVLKRDPGLLQREAMPDEEELQTKRDPRQLMRQAMPEEEELQTKRDPGQLMRQGMPEEEALQAKRDPGQLMRQGMEEEEELQTKRDAGLLRRAAEPAIGLEGGPVDDDMARQIDSLRGGGTGLSEGVRTPMESAFGADFAGVRVHQDVQSDALARNMAAKAFTTGSDIFLREDQNANDSSLLAHELTHVVQQSSGQAAGPAGMTVGPANDPHEQEADSVAAAISSGAAPALRRPDEGRAG
jgi:hypothetical protein